MPWHDGISMEWGWQYGQESFFFRARGFRIKGYWSHVLEPNEKPSISESFEVLYFVQKVFFVHSFTKKRIYRDLWWDKVKYKCEVLVFKHTPEISFRHGACQLRFTSAFGQECGKCAGLGSLNAQVREGSHTKFQLSCTLQFILSRSYNVFIMIMRILAMPAASTYQLSSQSVCPSAFNFFLGSMPSWFWQTTELNVTLIRPLDGLWHVHLAKVHLRWMISHYMICTTWLGCNWRLPIKTHTGRNGISFEPELVVSSLSKLWRGSTNNLMTKNLLQIWSSTCCFKSGPGLTRHATCKALQFWSSRTSPQMPRVGLPKKNKVKCVNACFCPCFLALSFFFLPVLPPSQR